jgi:PTH1 family peptidyl-tRNA hydrolase
MALLQRKPQFTSAAPLYSIGTNKTLLVVGLGNPGKKYENTRHNVGYQAIDTFAQGSDFSNWIEKRDLHSQLSSSTLGESRVILCKPQNFMNNSGQAVSAVQKFYRVYNQSTLIVYDELDLSFGQLRVREGGTDAGHNGIKSIITYAGDDFSRLRIGIANELSQKSQASDFVLANFTKEEQIKLPLILKEAVSIINEYIYGGQKISPVTRSVIIN